MQEQIITHLSRFVSFRTTAEEKEQKKACLDWIEETFLQKKQKHTMHGEIEDAPYLFLPHENPKLLWFAHIDVVPAEKKQFELQQEGDKLIGRGTSDMKGNQLPFLLAYRDALEAGEDPPVSILLTSDEETAGPTIPALLNTDALGKIPAAFTPDTGSRIVVEHKGVVWADLVCRGKGAHGAYPWNAENPVTLLIEALQKIESSFTKGTNDDWQMTVTVTQLHGSDARNQIPSVMTAGLDIRYPQVEISSAEEAVQKVQDVLPDGCTVEIVLSADGLNTDPNHKMVQLVKQIAEDVTGSEVKFEREHGGTDARYFGAKGIPAFLYGPEGGGIHGKEEWVSLRSLEQQYYIQKNLLHL